jgi:hypothetical protein
MNFWNDNTTLVTQRKWKMWIQKVNQSSVNINLKIKHNQMKNELVKCIEIFLIYIFLI